MGGGGGGVGGGSRNMATRVVTRPTQPSPTDTDAEQHFSRIQLEHYTKTREPVRRMHCEAGITCPTYIIWPVDQHMRNLLPGVNLLTFKKLEDITWHDITAEKWEELEPDEQSHLKADLWHYSRTSLEPQRLEAVAKYIQAMQVVQEQWRKNHQITIAFPCNDQASAFLIKVTVDSLLAYVSAHRRDFTRVMKEKNVEFVKNTEDSGVTIQQRKAHA